MLEPFEDDWYDSSDMLLTKYLVRDGQQGFTEVHREYNKLTVMGAVTT